MKGQHAASYASFGQGTGSEFNACEATVIELARQAKAAGVDFKSFVKTPLWKNNISHQTAMRSVFKGLLGK